MSDLRAEVEGLRKDKDYFTDLSLYIGHHMALDQILALIPEGAVLVTEETLVAALKKWWPMLSLDFALMPDDVRELIRHLREGT